MKPRIWQHKKTKKKFRVMPWCVIPDPIVEEAFVDKNKTTLVTFGCLAQIGWLIENEHQVWLGVGPSAAKSFKDLGEWRKK